MIKFGGLATPQTLLRLEDGGGGRVGYVSTAPQLILVPLEDSVRPPCPPQRPAQLIVTAVLLS